VSVSLIFFLPARYSAYLIFAIHLLFFDWSAAGSSGDTALSAMVQEEQLTKRSRGVSSPSWHVAQQMRPRTLEDFYCVTGAHYKRTSIDRTLSLLPSHHARMAAACAAAAEGLIHKRSHHKSFTTYQFRHPVSV